MKLDDYFKMSSDGKLSCRYTAFGRENKKGKILWRVPSFNLCFQTKTEEQLEVVMNAYLNHFTTQNLKLRGVKHFFYTLLKMGWRSEVEHTQTMYKVARGERLNSLTMGSSKVNVDEQLYSDSSFQKSKQVLTQLEAA